MATATSLHALAAAPYAAVPVIVPFDPTELSPALIEHQDIVAQARALADEIGPWVADQFHYSDYDTRREWWEFEGNEDHVAAYADENPDIAARFAADPRLKDATDYWTTAFVEGEIDFFDPDQDDDEE